MASFWDSLRDELRTVTGCEYLTRGAVKRALQVAAGAILDGANLGGVTVRRVVSPGTSTVWHVLETSEGDQVLLDAGDVATLRGVLLTYDETRPARPGDPLTEPMQLPNGLVVTEWPDGETWEV